MIHMVTGRKDLRGSHCSRDWKENTGWGLDESRFYNRGTTSGATDGCVRVGLRWLFLEPLERRGGEIRQDLIQN
jgi:hypothetical protein